MWRPISAWNPQDLAAICSLTLPLLPTKRLLLIVAAAAREKLNGFDSISANLYGTLPCYIVSKTCEELWRSLKHLKHGICPAPLVIPLDSACSLRPGHRIPSNGSSIWASTNVADHSRPQLDHNSNKPLVLHVGLALAATPHAGTITIAKYIRAYICYMTWYHVTYLTHTHIQWCIHRFSEPSPQLD